MKNSKDKLDLYFYEKFEKFIKEEFKSTKEMIESELNNCFQKYLFKNFRIKKLEIELAIKIKDKYIIFDFKSFNKITDKKAISFSVLTNQLNEVYNKYKSLEEQTLLIVVCVPSKIRKKSKTYNVRDLNLLIENFNRGVTITTPESYSYILIILQQILFALEYENTEYIGKCINELTERLNKYNPSKAISIDNRFIWLKGYDDLIALEEYWKQQKIIDESISLNSYFKIKEESLLNVENVPKIKWNDMDTRLILFMKVMFKYKIIEEPYNKWEMLCQIFENKNGKEYKPGLFSSKVNKYKPETINDKDDDFFKEIFKIDLKKFFNIIK